MQRAILNLLAMVKHYPALLDEFELPASIEREPFINRLLLEQGQQEVSITNPEVMAPLVGFWSRTRVRIWKKLADMVGYEYNPIWNVDGTTVHVGSSESHGTESGSSSEQRSGDSSEQRSGSRNYTRDRDQTDTLANTHNDTTDITRSETRTPNLTETTSPSGTETTIKFIAADNSTAWSNDTKSEQSFTNRSDSKRTSGTEATSGSETDTNAGGYTDTDTLAEDIEDTETTTGSTIGTSTGSTIGTSSGSRDQEGSDRWEETRQGNIGVTMTQQLLEAEKRLWELYDVESFIIKEFKQEFLLMVY